MTNQTRLGWAALVAAYCVGAACIPFEEAREEFCQNADPARQQELCPVGPGEDGGVRVDGGAGDGGTMPDGGTQPSCTVANECPAPSNPCLNAATCMDGECRYSSKEGEACDDGSACTLGDKCDSLGVCVGTLKLCNTPPNECFQSVGICTNGECAYSAKSADVACDDRNPCTLQDKCDGLGSCGGTLKACNTPPSPQCYEPTGVCDAANGECAYRAKPVNTVCNDGEACTYNDVCNGAGTCGGTALVCNTPSVCQEQGGTCVNGSCQYPFKSSGAVCSDNDACTEGDRCDGAGNCIPSNVVTECAGGFCQILGECRPESGCECPDGCASGVCI
jgi:hypothetical protein